MSAIKPGLVTRLRQSGPLLLGVLFLAMTVSYIDRLSLGIIAAPIKHALNIGDIAFGFLQGAAFAVAYSLATIPMGRCADLFDRRKLLLVGTLLAGGGAALTGLSDDFITICASRILVAVGGATIWPCGISLLSDRYPLERRGMVFGIFAMSVWLGASAAPIVSGVVFGLAQSGTFTGWPLFGHLEAWRQMLILIAATTLALFLLFAFMAEPRREGHAGASREPVFRFAIDYFIARRRFFGPLYLVLLIVEIYIFGAWAYQSHALMQRFDLPPGTAGLLVGMATLVSSIGGSLIGGWAADIGLKKGGVDGPVWIGFAACIATIPGFAMSLSGSATLAILGYCEVMALAVGVTAVLSPISMDVPERIRGLVAGLRAAISVLVGMSFGPLFVAILEDRLPYGNASTVVAIVIVGIAVIAAMALSLWSALGKDNVQPASARTT